MRCPDPFNRYGSQWVMSPNIPRLQQDRVNDKLQAGLGVSASCAMGWETANVHLGRPRAAKMILKDLKQRPEKWLYTASQAMAEAMAEDWEAWVRAITPMAGQTLFG